MGAGDELLIVEGTPAFRDGLRKLFEKLGYVCTAVGSFTEAYSLIDRKFFPAALVDLDVEMAGAGLKVVRRMKEVSPQTAVILLTGRRSFEAAVAGLRLGVVDIVIKRPEDVEHLKEAVSLACDRYRAGKGDEAALLKEVRSVLEMAFRILLRMARVVYRDVSVAATTSFRPRVLFVEGQPQVLQELSESIQDKGWEVAAEMTGGAALDKAGDLSFDIVAVRDELMDLKGSMVLKTIQLRNPETIGILYTEVDVEGKLEIFQEGSSTDAIRPFKGATQLVSKIEELVNTLTATQRDRRVITAFRGYHDEFFRRYAELKVHIDRILD